MILTKKFCEDPDLAQSHPHCTGTMVTVITTDNTTTETLASLSLLVVQNEKSGLRGPELEALLCYVLTYLTLCTLPLLSKPQFPAL